MPSGAAGCCSRGNEDNAIYYRMNGQGYGTGIALGATVPSMVLRRFPSDNVQRWCQQQEKCNLGLWCFSVSE